MKILSVVGARPQFIKLAPLINAIKKKSHSAPRRDIEHIITHTGQHYDYQMNKVFFDELGIPEPDHNLEIGSASHGRQTGEMIKKAEEVMIKENPDLVLVYGDTNSTFAGALAASKLGVTVAHVESGLRSYNRRMPEEINRVMTDHCSDILFSPTENASKNLKKEGFSNIANNGKLIDLASDEIPVFSSDIPVVMNVGDIMYDAILMELEIAEKKSNILEKLKLEPKRYFLATVHRAENSDDKERLKSILDAFGEISKKATVVFPVHPRTKKNLNSFHLSSTAFNQVDIIEPVSYYDMLILEKNADKILTDSGGMQKEAYFFEVPCITLREETEWVETLAGGHNILTGTNKNKIIAAVMQSDSGTQESFSMDLFGDGHTAERILRAVSLGRF